MKLALNLLILILILLLSSCTKPVKENGLRGSYIGQKLPGTTPQLFAEGIVSTGMIERDLSVSPDGNEIYFSVRYQDKFAIVVTKKKNGIWTSPEVTKFSGLYNDIEPFIQPDGKKMFFVSKRPLMADSTNKYKYNMWYMTKIGNTWGNPKPVGEPINGSGSVFYPSITKDGTMYFTRRFEDNSEFIFRSKLVNGKYSEPEKLPQNINSTNAQYNTFISPDEDFIIVPTWREKDSFGASDYYVSFRNEDDTWSELINLGDKINTKRDEYTPSLSPDGKYFFFQRIIIADSKNEKPVSYSDIKKKFNQPENGNSDIYWVDAKVIKILNPYKK